MASERDPAAHVLFERHRFEVRRIDASRNPAEMVKRHPIRDRPDQQLIGVAMGTDRA